MLGWFRREKPQREMPESWLEILARNAEFREWLTPELREQFDRRLVSFVDAKNWEGLSGLELTDEHKVTVAAHAIRLVLAFEDDIFKDVKSVLISPDEYEARTQHPLGGAAVVEGIMERAGEAWYRGPVILAWSDIESCLGDHPYFRHRYPRNVILHEFAHQLDYRNGRYADGIPPIESDEQAAEWIDVTNTAFKRLTSSCSRGQPTLLDCYGTTNLAEFFAVATEAFFEAPADLAEQWPDLFRVFQRYYQQDPRSLDEESDDDE